MDESTPPAKVTRYYLIQCMRLFGASVVVVFYSVFYVSTHGGPAATRRRLLLRRAVAVRHSHLFRDLRLRHHELRAATNERPIPGVGFLAILSRLLARRRDRRVSELPAVR